MLIFIFSCMQEFFASNFHEKSHLAPPPPTLLYYQSTCRTSILVFLLSVERGGTVCLSKLPGEGGGDGAKIRGQQKGLGLFQ
jgi:hypothetical protein